MADRLLFSLVSPARELYHGEVEHVVAPGTDGEFGVLPHHAPFMSTLKNGLVKVLEGNTVSMRVFVRGGFADVTPDGLTILAEEAHNLADVTPEDLSKEIETVRYSLEKEPDNPAFSERLTYLDAMQKALVN